MIKRSIALTMLVAVLSLFTGSPVLAGTGGIPSASASCLGQEAAGISPVGSSDEFPGGMPQLVTVVRQTFGSVGPIAAFIAKLHEGSHEACDEATE